MPTHKEAASTFNRLLLSLEEDESIPNHIAALVFVIEQIYLSASKE